MDGNSPKRLPRYRECFVCGRNNPYGLDVQFLRAGDRIVADWTPAPEHRGYADRVHGGVAAALMDEAMGWAPTCATRRMCYSAEIRVRYRRSIPTGAPLRVEAWTVETRRRLFRAEGRLLDAEDQVLATASGTYVPLPEEEAREVLAYLYVEGEEERAVTVEDF